MLTAIREKTQGIIAIFIVGLLIIPFAFWGLESYFSGGLGNVVAEVNGTDITRNIYDSELRRYRTQAPKLLESKAGRRQILDDIIYQQLQIDSVLDEGFIISDHRLQGLLKGHRQFQTNGKFDQLRYQYYLRNIGFSAYGFESSLRRRGALQQINTGISQSGIVTKAERDTLLKLQGQRRSFDFVALSVSKYLGKKTFSDDELKQYYQKNLKQYMNPERVRIEYVVLSIAELAKRFRPTEDEIRAEYNKNKDSFATKEKRRISHILIKLPSGATPKQQKQARAKAQSILKQAKSGKNFSALARKYSDDPGSKVRGGDVGVLKRGTMVPPFEQAALALKANRVSGLVRTTFGFHILKLTQYTPSRKLSLKVVKARISKEIASSRAEDRFSKLYSDFNNLVYEQPDSLKPVAEKIGLKIEKTDWFTRSGGKGLAGNPDVVKEAFKPEVVSQKRNGDSLELGSDKLVALRVIAHEPQKAKLFNEVKARITKTMEIAHAQQLANTDGKKLLQQARTGNKGLKLLAASFRASYKQNYKIERRRVGQLAPQIRGIAKSVFQAGQPKQGKPVLGGVEVPGFGYIVFALSKVTDGSTKVNVTDIGAARLLRLLQNRRGSGYFENYRRGLKDAADIKVNEKLL